PDLLDVVRILGDLERDLLDTNDAGTERPLLRVAAVRGLEAVDRELQLRHLRDEGREIDLEFVVVTVCVLGCVGHFQPPVKGSRTQNYAVANCNRISSASDPEDSYGPRRNLEGEASPRSAGPPSRQEF